MFTGNTAPYHITQPSTDYDVQIVSSTATMANLTCSLNVTIPESVQPFWQSNIRQSGIRHRNFKNDNSIKLQIENPQPSDAGVYQCVFDDTYFDGSEWKLIRSIRLLITSMFCTNVLFNAMTISVIGLDLSTAIVTWQLITSDYKYITSQVFYSTECLLVSFCFTFSS